jgi:WD40 repeat protein
VIGALGAPRLTSYKQLRGTQFVCVRAQVCGLKWSPDDRELASGGNDNLLYIWSPQTTQPLLRFQEHQARCPGAAFW